MQLFCMVVVACMIIVAKWDHIVIQNWVNIGSGNGLLPNDTKLLPEQMLTSHQKCSFLGFHLRAFS